MKNCTLIFILLFPLAAFTQPLKELDYAAFKNNGQLPASVVNKNVFIKTEASTLNAFVGEPILVTYKFYTCVQAQSKVIKMPIFTGCSVQEMTNNDIVPEVERHNGKLFRVTAIRKVQLIPLHEGNILLDTASVENIFAVYDKGVTEEQIKQQKAFSHDEVFITNSTPVNITVTALPNNNAQNSLFTGAIGQFAIVATLNKKTDTANETNTLKISIAGSGNFASIHCPTINWPKEFTAYETNNNESVNKFVFPNTGVKEFNVPFTVIQKGNYTIPAIEFVYFDVATKNYITQKTDSLSITVLPALTTAFDESKLQKDITNKKYFWIVPAIALLAGIGWWLRFGKKTTHKATAETIEKLSEPTISTTHQSKTSLAEQVQTLEWNLIDDAVFFTKAKQIATEILATNHVSESSKTIAATIVQQCNTALYAGNDTLDKHFMIHQLKCIVG